MKPTGYFVTKRDRCASCDGIGVVQHPEWREYRTAHQDVKWPLFTDMEAWFAARGYSPSNVPPEEINCPDCDGKGYVESEVALSVALAALHRAIC